MMAHPIPQPAARTFTVDELVRHVRDGRVRIPQFQRALRWGWEDCRRLFDSILKGYPIGSLLLWHRPAEAAKVKIGAIVVDSQQVSDGWWVVDGQQRLTSLANALSDEGLKDVRFALALDIHRDILVKPPEVSQAHIIPLPVLFDLQRLFRWFQEHPEVSEKMDDASGATKAIREFTIPAYIVEQRNETILREIFDRMNNAGKRLSRAEVFAALHPAESGDARSFDLVVDAVERDLAFGRLDGDTVLRVILARRGGDVNRQIRDEFSEHARRVRDFGDESESDAYREGQLALERAVKFLQRDAGVPHVALLPYRYLLVILSRFFAHFPEPEQRNRSLLRRWYWRAALVGPQAFDSWTNAMRVLASEIVATEETQSVQRLLDRIKHGWHKPNLERFRTNQADTRIALCAMWDLEPRSPSTGQPYAQSDLAEAIAAAGTPRDALARFVASPRDEHANWAANRFFLLGEEPEESPADIFGSAAAERHGVVQEWPAILQSHSLNEELVERLAAGDITACLDARQAILHGVVARFIQRMAEPEFEDTPPLDSLTVDDLEDDSDEFKG